MNGQMSICQVCMFQDRREENGQETRCVAGSPKTDYDTCAGFVILGGPALGARLAELYNHLDLAWDMIMTILAAIEGPSSALVVGDRDPAGIEAGG